MRLSTFVALVIAASLAACRPSMHTFPNDVNGDVFRRMAAGGDDLSKSRDVDFEFLFVDEQKAKGFAEEARANLGMDGKIKPYGEGGVWQATVTKQMLPTYVGISALEQTLIRLAKPYGGKPDGWGSFQVNKLK